MMINCSLSQTNFCRQKEFAKKFFLLKVIFVERKPATAMWFVRKFVYIIVEVPLSWRTFPFLKPVLGHETLVTRASCSERVWLRQTILNLESSPQGVFTKGFFRELLHSLVGDMKIGWKMIFIAISFLSHKLTQSESLCASRTQSKSFLIKSYLNRKNKRLRNETRIELKFGAFPICLFSRVILSSGIQ